MKQLLSYVKKKKWWLLVATVLLFWLISLPSPLFEDPLSSVLVDKNDQLLAAKIASDGQWRFPLPDSVPYRFEKAITTFEDKRFYYHPGVDPISMGRAVVQNIKAGKVISGGSTLTMQVIRLARKGKQRTIWEKLIEVWLATRLELSYSKKEILQLYAGHAPFGGNVVGLEAATWRFFGKKPTSLSWGEAATLAVLPNSPALIHPGRNRELLMAKRNRLLDDLLENEIIDSISWSLAKEEAIPPQPFALPRYAPHLLDRLSTDKDLRKAKIQTTLDRQLQIEVNTLAKRHYDHLSENEIHNLAIMVMDVETGEVMAYTGNIMDAGIEHGQSVDIIKAPRSSGSILKPILYAFMLDEGDLLPHSVVPDVPINYAGYSPENYSNTYDGLVSAQKAITRSLNVPLVRMLELHGLEKFHFELSQKMHFTTFNRSATYYGLPLILGGGEINLEEITNSYACMARTLIHFNRESSQYFKNDFRPPGYLRTTVKIENPSLGPKAEAPVLGAGAIWSAFEAMRQLERPDQMGNWEVFSNSRQIAWKTGTSFGFRDAWAVGVSKKYAVGIWVGNADGEGRPGLIGVHAAAPILFDVFDLLPNQSWFEQPYDDMIEIDVCAQSGDLATHLCPAKKEWVPAAGKRSNPCKRHTILHLDALAKYSVHAGCYPPENMKHLPWFILSPLEEHFYKTVDPGYKPIPPFKEGCHAVDPDRETMELIYPRKFTQIYVPKGFAGKQEHVIFKATHRKKEATIYWHIDQTYVGKTMDFHHLECAPPVGKHTLTLIDQDGHEIKQAFEIVEK
ncbi:MAG: penicillin-binding protein 1C [Saprospiraceae bacterium]|nr:penicillin-binding protein 1C [Saprospiraceae bacterium]